MGTPPQMVSHFILQDEYYFIFKKKTSLSYNYYKFSQFLNKENLSNFWFDNNKSSTFIIDDDEEVFKDIYYFYTINNSIAKVVNLSHNIEIQV